MAAKNIFYRIPSQRGIRVATLSGADCTLDQFCNYIIDSEGLNRNDFIVASGTKVFRPSSCNLQLISLQNNSHVDILIPLLGGKGGFGSLLRAIGAQIEKTTNKDACRDLSGRRLRDIKKEEELKKLLALQEKLIEEREIRRREKIEKLRKKSEESTASKSIQELVRMFDDNAYNRRRLEVGDILEAAIDKGIINFRKRKMDEKLVDAEKKPRLDRPELNSCEALKEQSKVDEINRSSTTELAQEVNEESTNNEDDPQLQSYKTSVEASKSRLKCKHNDLWLGLEEDL